MFVCFFHKRRLATLHDKQVGASRSSKDDNFFDVDLPFLPCVVCSSPVPVLECIVKVRALDGASVCVDLDCSEDSPNEPAPLSLDWVSSSKKLFSASSYLTLGTSSLFVCARWLNDSD
ncbi:hypothetical protein ISCGN_016611 [Ixodes scapularis]